MKVVTGKSMQRLDRLAIEEFGVSGLTLMENAGRGCAETILAEFGAGPMLRAVIVAGKGNNGGDGYVIAHQLHQKGWQVLVCVLAEKGQISGDATVNLVGHRQNASGGIRPVRGVQFDGRQRISLPCATGLLWRGSCHPHRPQQRHRPGRRLSAIQ